MKKELLIEPVTFNQRIDVRDLLGTPLLDPEQVQSFEIISQVADGDKLTRAKNWEIQTRGALKNRLAPKSQRINASAENIYPNRTKKSEGKRAIRRHEDINFQAETLVNDIEPDFSSLAFEPQCFVASKDMEQYDEIMEMEGILDQDSLSGHIATESEIFEDETEKIEVDEFSTVDGSVTKVDLYISEITDLMSPEEATFKINDPAFKVQETKVLHDEYDFDSEDIAMSIDKKPLIEDLFE